MRKFGRPVQILTLGASLLALGGCVSSVQVQDFVRTETARVIADTIGRTLQLFIQATT